MTLEEENTNLKAEIENLRARNERWKRAFRGYSVEAQSVSIRGYLAYLTDAVRRLEHQVDIRQDQIEKHLQDQKLLCDSCKRKCNSQRHPLDMPL